MKDKQSKGKPPKPLGPWFSDRVLREARRCWNEGKVTFGHPHLGEVTNDKEFTLLDIQNALFDSEARVERKPEFFNKHYSVYIYYLFGSSQKMRVQLVICFTPDKDEIMLGIMTGYFLQRPQRPRK